jgi:hypothetical protein
MKGISEDERKMYEYFLVGENDLIKTLILKILELDDIIKKIDQSK